MVFFGGHVSNLKGAIKVLRWWGLKPSPRSQSHNPHNMGSRGPIWLPAITSAKIMGDCSRYAKSYFDFLSLPQNRLLKQSDLCTTPGGSIHRGYQAVRLTQYTQQRRGIRMGLCTLYLQSNPPTIFRSYPHWFWHLANWRSLQSSKQPSIPVLCGLSGIDIDPHPCS